MAEGILRFVHFGHESLEYVNLPASKVTHSNGGQLNISLQYVQICSAAHPFENTLIPWLVRVNRSLFSAVREE
jgi:hypothetical protein